MRSFSLLSLFDNYAATKKQPEELKEVKVVNPPRETYTVVQIDPYTLEERLIMYPILEEEDNDKLYKKYNIIDIE